MTAEELLRQVRARGGTFQVLGDNRLKVHAASPLPDGMMEELRQHKTAILSLLISETPENRLDGAEHDETAKLLAWAAAAAEEGLALPQPIQFLETPLRPFTTAEVGRYCRDQLRILFMARSNRAAGGWGRFTPEWWDEMESKSIESLAAVKLAVDDNGDETE